LLNYFRKDRSIIKKLFTDIILRMETYYYTVLKILNEAKNRANLPYDIEEICSVKQKAKRGDSWLTDIIAIRNCISHAKTKIDDIIGVTNVNEIIAEISSNLRGALGDIVDGILSNESEAPIVTAQITTQSNSQNRPASFLSEKQVNTLQQLNPFLLPTP
jgi:hypothetical protein